MNTIKNNEKLSAEIGRIAEVAGYLWTKGWAERNGGNISVNLTDLMSDVEKALPALGPAIPLQEAMTALAGHIFYVTGTGKRMRYVAQNPFANGSLIRIAGDDYSAEVVKSRFLKIDSSHIEYVLERMRENTTLCPQYQEISAGGAV